MEGAECGICYLDYDVSREARSLTACGHVMCASACSSWSGRVGLSRALLSRAVQVAWRQGRRFGDVREGARPWQVVEEAV
ncbi:hypothetical protein GDO86_007039 [Hymenochirus boettgeri]|uniref:RING-type domain-containing protein n=1 Tax=Hymenochirus boettgeri TaxID=247094 RepID=A0A8T2J8I8_9PIPI|nr:hypothetical protein GDO86_007039 [Hymenochirus boettgeri]